MTVPSTLQPLFAERAYPLHDTATTRRMEQAAFAGLPSHALMQRAGLAVAQLALAKVPHARHIWVACGPGNNGGDGLEAAMHLQQQGKQVTVTWLGSPQRSPADALASWARATAHGITLSATPPAQWDLCIDALLGIGADAAPRGVMADWIAHMHTQDAPVLAVDVPSGLAADTGALLPQIATLKIANNAMPTCRKADFTLSLLTLKPGLFTAHGRDMAGEVWWDSLGLTSLTDFTPCARRSGSPVRHARTHAAHKGSFGDVAIIGGATGMTGAAWLAGSAALHAGAGRVFVGLLAESAEPTPSHRTGAGTGTMLQPELMSRDVAKLLEADSLQRTVVVCGCGGADAVAGVLPTLLQQAPRLVLDADALNAIANNTALQAQLRERSGLGLRTVLTPHPLEAARLLGLDTSLIQSDRLLAAAQLCERYRSVVVLKGSGTVIAEPEELSRINPTGNAKLATAGTGDVLAGAIGAAWGAIPLDGAPRSPHASADRQSALFEAVCTAVYQHGHVADAWPAHRPLTAGALARRLSLC